MSNREFICVPVAEDNPAIEKDGALCSNCGHCLAVCMEEVGAARYKNSLPGGGYTCLNCGQCTSVCPEQCLRGKKTYPEVLEAIHDPEKIVIFSVAPSVRVGLGDCFQEKTGCYVEDKVVSALRSLGADYVFDVTFSADLTIMEEGTEFIKRLLGGKGTLPQFTSCCPGWVKFVESHHPELIPHLSTAKSPISMQGATIKTYFADKMKLDPAKIVNVAVTPCTAKKFEIRREELCDAGKLKGITGMRDNDYVITTRELADWIKEAGIDFLKLPPSDFDCMLSKGSGGGVIFGNTGGVMEAALRMAYKVLTKEAAPELLLDFKPVRGLENLKEAQVTVAGQTIKLAVIYGLPAAEECIAKTMKDYDFIEVMTCPGGCISGGGQPAAGIIPVPDSLRESRIASLYGEDRKMKIRNALDNPEIDAIYREFYDCPLSERAKELLHTEYKAR